LRWIFAQRLTGRSVASIARELNETGVPCPSSAGPDRNPHRSGQASVGHTWQNPNRIPAAQGPAVLVPAVRRRVV
jgi:hypothetical protein